MRNDYYVYVYVRLDNNSIFYVGKGTGIRMYRIEDYMRTNHFINILNKTPCAVYKLYDNLTEEEALKIIFLPTETITLPPEGVTAKIRERFIFDEEGIKKECIRTFEIDHDGKVVKYYGEKIRTVIYDNINNYYAGILGENFNPLNEEQL